MASKNSAKPTRSTATPRKQSAKPGVKPVSGSAKAGKKVAPASRKPAPSKPALAKPASTNGTSKHVVPERPPVKLTPFLSKQRERLLILKDTLLDSMNGVARDSLRSQSGGEASAFGMHQADAGSDAYDRDFALSLLSQEQDSLYEIDQALKRVDGGSYGVCEMSSKPIPKARLEALPFTRYTVECQAEIEKRSRYQRFNPSVTSLFGLTDDESDGDEEESTPDSKD